MAAAAAAAAHMADVSWKMLELRARCKRSGSIYEPLKSINLPKPEGESLWDKLDHYYRIVKSTLLLHQSPTTGLFPTKTYGDNQKAKVHDNLYCAACSWALALAYRRIDDDKGRTHELEHSAIKCMRGILYCYMRQADKVQQFKQDPKPSGCLHSVFNAHTGDEVFSHNEYGHLQINAVSLFLLYLVEMISSGLQIIYNTDEVSFIQNLVFCVERAYRVPDFGVWERGSKYNNGCPELHSSSVGLAKAALEAINGFNLFGNQGCSWSVIFVDFDAHNRNRQTLCSLLPRESRSHNTDAALLPCISYPAFALDDEALFSQTLDKIIRKLKGKYGFKRFLRDGYRTALEDKTRRYYKPAEIKLFDGIECEFPLFFIFMIIDGVFRGNLAQVKEYQDLLDPVLQHTPEGCPVVPKYYYVPADFVELEKKNPGSQKRFPSNSGRDGRFFLWGQAVYVIAKLLADKLVSPKDMDPIGRYVPPEEQRNVSMRFSNQGPLENDLVVHVALIAESQRLQVFLNTYGIQTQTPQQVEPIQIWAHKELVKAYFHLGVNDKLGLSGRPDRPIGCLGTSKIYRILGKTVVCYSIIFDLSDFYMSQDVMMLIDDIKNALQFIKQYWKMHGRPLFVVLIREDNIRGSRFNPVLDMLAAFKKGIVGGVKVHVDRVQTLISGAVVEQLDFLRITEAEEAPVFKSLEELDLPKHSKVKRQSSTPNASELEQQPDININDWKNKSTYEILQKLDDCNCLASQALLLSILLKREGPNFITKEGTVAEHIERIYRRAGSKKLWWIIHAMKYELQFRAGDMPAKDLYQMSPSEVKQLLLDILQPQQQGRGWLNRRQIDGSLNRTPAGFYDRVWQILERTPNGLIVAGRFLPQQPTLSDMTMYEMNFSLLVEDMLQNIDQPEYRQIIVELLMVISVILERNPELEFQDKVDLDKVVQEAFHDFQKDHSRPKGAEHQDDMTAFYNTHPVGKKGTCSYLSKAVISLLLEGDVKTSNDDPCTIS
ncbi:phosphorylase b kinase regulatory subunit beta isoform X3 [Numida meleagris]|uniref:phosphorylase b kinase regulatory subunit beta isoform X3 n=1 Tax=Numida meleagris TaxID=8996 RepID=UPI000B3D80EF|nr:phosphorylase b kinase regulatory subunit beta isoform X3 [Numida meleagris]